MGYGVDGGISVSDWDDAEQTPTYSDQDNIVKDDDNETRIPSAVARTDLHEVLFHDAHLGSGIGYRVWASP